MDLLQVELDIRTASLSLARSMEQQLLASGYQLASAVRQPLAAVEQELSNLEETWQRRQQQLQQALEQQVGPRPAPAYPTLRTLRVSTALVKAKAKRTASLGCCCRSTCSCPMAPDPWFSNLNHQKGHTPVCVVTGPSPDFLFSFLHQLLLSSVEKVERWLDSEESSLASEGLAVGAQEEWGRMAGSTQAGQSHQALSQEQLPSILSVLAPLGRV